MSIKITHQHELSFDSRITLFDYLCENFPQWLTSKLYHSPTLDHHFTVHLDEASIEVRDKKATILLIQRNLP